MSKKIKLFKSTTYYSFWNWLIFVAVSLIIYFIFVANDVKDTVMKAVDTTPKETLLEAEQSVEPQDTTISPQIESKAKDEFVECIFTINITLADLITNFFEDKPFTAEIQILRSYNLSQDAEKMLKDLEEYSEHYLTNDNVQPKVIFPTNTFQEFIKKFVVITKESVRLDELRAKKEQLKPYLKALTIYFNNEKFIDGLHDKNND
jgi:hypothetical protein